MYGRNLKAYQKTNINAELSVADPYVVTKMLFQGLNDRMAQAKGAIERNDLLLKSKKLSSAIAIIENLRSTLDFSKSESLATNLYRIYSYMIKRLNDASIELTANAVDDAMKAFAPIKAAWESISVDAQKEAQSLRSQEQLNIDLNHDAHIAKGYI